MGRAPLVGQRIRKRRQELGAAQSAIAARVGISPSYLNLIEHNKRPLSRTLLHRIAATIGLDSQALTGTEEERLVAELGEVAADAGLSSVDLSTKDAAEAVANNPKAARAILSLYRAYREARLRSDLLGERLGEETFLAEISQQIVALITTIRSYAEILKDYGDLSDVERSHFSETLAAEAETLAGRATEMFDFMSGRGTGRPRALPREEVEDFISDRANYFPQLEAAAEQTLAQISAVPTIEILSDRLFRNHGIHIERLPPATLPPDGERLDGSTFLLSDGLARSSARFRLARLLGTLECEGILDGLMESATLTSKVAAERLRRALASYYAGALNMPYLQFQAAAEALRLDVTRICHRFDASFEQVCHRLTTLRRRGAEGIPLHFLRTDIAGNISKRFSASGLSLPRYGGACSRWIVHHAFTAPGRIVAQIGRLPEGETYFSIACANAPQSGPEAAEPCHAVMIGCAIEHANRLVYADGLALTAPRAIPIGITCRQCPREDCAQRVFDRVTVGLPARTGGDSGAG